MNPQSPSYLSLLRESYGPEPFAKLDLVLMGLGIGFALGCLFARYVLGVVA